MRKTVIAAWSLSLLGTGLWTYGYFARGSPALIGWHSFTPWWIADFLPNIQSEIGMALVCAGTVLSYWPSRSSD